MSSLKTTIQLTAEKENFVVFSEAKEHLTKVADQSEKATQEIDELNQSASSLNSKMLEAANSAKAMVAAFAVGGGLAIAADDVLALGKELSLLETKLGVAPQAMQTWGLAAESVGLDLETMGNIFKDTSDKIGDFLITDGGGALDIIERLGLDVQQLKAMSPDKILLEIGHALDHVKDVSKHEGIFLLESLADEGSALLPLLKDNAKALNEIREKTELRGQILNPRDMEILTEANKKINETKAAFKGLKHQIGLLNAEFIVLKGTGFTEYIDSISRALHDFDLTLFVEQVKHGFVLAREIAYQSTLGIQHDLIALKDRAVALFNDFNIFGESGGDFGLGLFAEHAKSAFDAVITFASDAKEAIVLLWQADISVDEFFQRISDSASFAFADIKISATDAFNEIKAHLSESELGTAYLEAWQSLADGVGLILSQLKETVGGIWRDLFNLDDSLSDFEAFKEGVNRITDSIGGGLTEFYETLGGAFGKASEDVGDVLKELETTWDSFTLSTNDLENEQRDGWSSIEEIISASFDIVGEIIERGWDLAVSLTTASLMLIRGDYEAAYQEIDNATSDFFDSLESSFEGLTGDLIPADLSDAFADIFLGLEIIATDSLNFIAQAIPDLMLIFRELVDTVLLYWDEIAFVTDVVWQSIVNIVNFAWEAVTTVILTGLQILQGDFSNAWATIKTGLHNLAIYAQNALYQMVERPLRAMAGAAGRLMMNVLRSIGNAIKSGTGYLVTAMYNLAVKMVNSFTKRFGIEFAKKPIFQQAGMSAGAAFADGVGNTGNLVGDALNESGEQAVVSFSSTLSNMASANDQAQQNIQAATIGTVIASHDAASSMSADHSLISDSVFATQQAITETAKTNSNAFAAEKAASEQRIKSSREQLDVVAEKSAAERSYQTEAMKSTGAAFDAAKAAEAGAKSSEKAKKAKEKETEAQKAAKKAKNDAAKAAERLAKAMEDEIAKLEDVYKKMTMNGEAYYISTLEAKGFTQAVIDQAAALHYRNTLFKETEALDKELFKLNATDIEQYQEKLKDLGLTLSDIQVLSEKKTEIFLTKELQKLEQANNKLNNTKLESYRQKLQDVGFDVEKINSLLVKQADLLYNQFSQKLEQANNKLNNTTLDSYQKELQDVGFDVETINELLVKQSDLLYDQFNQKLDKEAFNQLATDAEKYRNELEKSGLALDKINELVSKKISIAYKAILADTEKQYLKLTLSNDEFRALELKQKGFSKAQIESVITQENYNKELEESQKKTEDLAKSISGSLTDAFMSFIENGKVEFDGFKSWILKTFNSMVLRPAVEFVTGQIGQSVAGMFTGTAAKSGASGVSGGSSMLSSLSNVKSMFGGNSVGSSIAKVGGNLGTSAFSNAGSMANWQYGAAGALGGLFGDKAFGGYGGVGGSLGATVGMAVGGPIGAVIGGLGGGALGGLFGGKWESQHQGLNLNYGGGQFSGSQYETFKQEGGWLKSDKHKRDDSALNAELDKRLSEYFEQIEKGLIENAEKFGITSAESVIESFNAGVLEFGTDGKSEEEINQILTDWMGGINDSLYHAVFGAEYDQFKLEGETLAETFARLHVSITAVESITDALGLDFELVGHQAAVASQVIIEAAGGLESLVQNSSIYYEQFYSETEKLERTLMVAKEAVTAFNETHNASITSKESLREFVDGLDRTTIAGQKAFGAAMQLAPTLLELDSATTKLTESNKKSIAVFKKLGLNVEMMGQQFAGTSQAIIESAGGLEALTKSSSIYYEQFYTETEKLEHTLTVAKDAVATFNETHNASITSKESLRQFVDSLDLTTKAGQAAFGAAMQLAPALLDLDSATTKLTESNKKSILAPALVELGAATETLTENQKAVDEYKTVVDELQQEIITLKEQAQPAVTAVQNVSSAISELESAATRIREAFKSEKQQLQDAINQRTMNSDDYFVEQKKDKGFDNTMIAELQALQQEITELDRVAKIQNTFDDYIANLNNQYDQLTLNTEQLNANAFATNNFTEAMIADINALQAKVDEAAKTAQANQAFEQYKEQLKQTKIELTEGSQALQDYQWRLEGLSDEMIAQLHSMQTEVERIQQERINYQTNLDNFGIDIVGVSERYQANIAALNELYQDQIETFKQLQSVADDLKAAVNGLKYGNLSILPPKQQLEQARAEFNTMLAAAKSGDLAAAQGLSAAGNNLLGLSRQYNASSAAYVADYNLVTNGMEHVADEIQAMHNPQLELISLQEGLLEKAKQELRELIEQNKTLLDQNDLLTTLDNSVGNIAPELGVIVNSAIGSIQAEVAAQQAALDANNAVTDTVTVITNTTNNNNNDVGSDSGSSNAASNDSRYFDDGMVTLVESPRYFDDGMVTLVESPRYFDDGMVTLDGMEHIADEIQAMHDPQLELISLQEDLLEKAKQELRELIEQNRTLLDQNGLLTTLDNSIGNIAPELGVIVNSAISSIQAEVAAQRAAQAAAAAAAQSAISSIQAEVAEQQAALAAQQAAAQSALDANNSVSDSGSSSAASNDSRYFDDGMVTLVSGSHFGGLPRVPYNGYIAETHEDEAIIDAETMSRLRRYGIQAKTTIVNQSNYQSANNNGDARELVRFSRETAEEVRKLRKEITELRKNQKEDNEHAAQQRETQHQTSKKQVKHLDDMQQNERLNKKVAVGYR